MRDEMLAILRCPVDHSLLSRADAAVVDQLNAKIRARRLRNVRGYIVEHSLDGGLIRSSGDLLYPIVDQIPVMLHDEAIPLEQLLDPTAMSQSV